MKRDLPKLKRGEHLLFVFAEDGRLVHRIRVRGLWSQVRPLVRDLLKRNGRVLWVDKFDAVAIFPGSL